MDNYNSLNLVQCEGTKLAVRSGIMQRVASNGAVRVRSMQTQAKRDPQVVHYMINAIELASFLNFYQTNRARQFTFTGVEDGVERTCVFNSKGYEVVPLSGALYTLTVFMMEV